MEATRARTPSRRPTNPTAQLWAEVKSGPVCPPLPEDRSQSDVRQVNRRLHNSAPRGSTENKRPTPIAQPNPFRRRAILASSNQCLPHSAVRRSVRQPAGSLNNRIPSPPMIALLPSVSSFVRPVRNPLPGPAATGSAPLPPAGFKGLLYVNSLIVKAKMALFGQNWALRQTHSHCTILHRSAQSCTTGVQP